MAPVHSSDHLVANTHLPETGLRELASGVDALYLSGPAELPRRFLARLGDCRAWAGEAKRPAPCAIGDLTFGITPHGWGKYRFCLDHEMARIGFSTSRHLPTVRIQPRSEFLHAVGPEAAVRAVHELLDNELGRLRFWVNRRPLCRLAGLVVVATRGRPTLRPSGGRPTHLRSLGPSTPSPSRLRGRQTQAQRLACFWPPAHFVISMAAMAHVRHISIGGSSLVYFSFWTPTIFIGALGVHLELGRGSPTLDTIVRVAAALDVDPAELVSGLRP